MRLIFAAIALTASIACESSDDSTGLPETGVRLTVEYDSVLDVRTLDISGAFQDGTMLDHDVREVPLSLDPPGIRQVEMVLEIEKLGFLGLAADGLGGDSSVLGSGRSEVTIVSGELAPVKIVLGAPVVCGDGLRSGIEGCDDNNTLAGDGCSPTCLVETGWDCGASVCKRCGNGKTEPGEMCDDSNVIAGDGCSDTCTLEGKIVNVYEIEQLETQATTSATWVAIPGAELSFPPNASGETWVVFASGKLRSSDPTEITAELRLMVDGAESDLLGHQTTGATENWAGFVTFDRVVPGSTSPITVSLEFRAEVGTTEADDLRIVAMRMPASADFQFLELDDIEEAIDDDADLATLRFTPSFAGDYLVFAKLDHSELPGADTVRTWFEDDLGNRHPDDANGTGFSNGRSPWVPVFVAFSQNLDLQEHAFTLHGASSATNNTTWWDRAFAHRVPVLVSSATVTPAGYSIAATFDHAALVAAGESRSDGFDIRVVFQGNEIDRVLDPDSAWNQSDTTIWFSTVNPIAAGDTGVYLAYFGNPNAGSPPEDPELVFPLFDGFDDSELDPALWSVVTGRAVVSGGELTVAPTSGVRQLGSYAENTVWEVKSRLSSPIGYRMNWLVGQGAGGAMSWFTDEGDHHAASNDFITHFVADTPTSFHVWRIERDSNVAVRFFQDQTLIATHPNDLVPLGPLSPSMVDEHMQNSMIYDWVRIRSYVNPGPTVSVGAIQSFRGGAPSRWAHRKIMAFRRDAFDLTEYAESLDAEINATADPIVKTELTTSAPPEARDYVSIQSMRISGQNYADARKVGRLTADGTELLATSHKITRGSEDGNGYHHVAGVVDVRNASAPILLQNAYASPELIEVRAAESVIIVLRFPK